MSGFIFVDGNSIGRAAHNTTVLTANGVQTQAIFQSLKMLKTARKRHADLSTVVWLWDGRAQFRYDIYSGYKGKRDDDPKKVADREQYNKAVPHIKRALTLLGIDQLLAPNFEADDLAGFLIRRSGDQRVALISGDEDWAQFITGRVSWCDPRVRPARTINRVNMQQELGFQTGVQLLQAKALKGDTSDNIPGVGGIGEKTADKIIRHFGGVVQLVDAYRALPNGFQKESLPEELVRERNKLNKFCESGLPLFKRNMTLMNLMSKERDPLIAKDVKRTPGAQDWNAFITFCREFSFLSILDNLDEWKSVFTHTRKAA